MFGKLNAQEIDALLHQQIVGRIGCQAENKIYVVPISYVYDGTCIYGHALEGMKIFAMRKNPHICFEVDNLKNLANWQSVICWGEYEELSNDDDRHDALKKLEARVLPILSSETMHLSPQWPFPAASAETVKGVFFRIRITEKTGRFEKSPQDKIFSM